MAIIERIGRKLRRAFAQPPETPAQSLARVGRIATDSSRAGEIDAAGVHAMMRSAELDAEWERVGAEVDRMTITDRALGVNPGDRRAIYYLVRQLRPRRVLEVGTHIGASTAHIATALRELEREDPTTKRSLVTLDIYDVNDPTTRSWEKFGAARSPRELMAALGCDGLVEFVAKGSEEYFAGSSTTFDLIFLDGDHAAATVYREVPAALGRLDVGGHILLHDFFPRLEPLWSNGSVIEGPWLAIERHRSEGAAIEVVALGALPWPTKLGSNVTSLALLGRPRGARA